MILRNGAAHFHGRFMWRSMPTFKSICQVLMGWWQEKFSFGEEGAQLWGICHPQGRENTVSEASNFLLLPFVFPLWPLQHTYVIFKAIQGKWQILCVWKISNPFPLVPQGKDCTETTLNNYWTYFSLLKDEVKDQCTTAILKGKRKKGKKQS